MILPDHNLVDLWQVLAISDAVISMVMGTPQLEAACCGKPGFSYAPTKNAFSPIYTKGYGKVTFDMVGPLLNAINKTLDLQGHNPWNELKDLMSEIDPYLDSCGVKRMRNFILRAASKDFESSPHRCASPLGKAR